MRRDMDFCNIHCVGPETGRSSTRQAFSFLWPFLKYMQLTTIVAHCLLLHTRAHVYNYFASHCRRHVMDIYRSKTSIYMLTKWTNRQCIDEKSSTHTNIISISISIEHPTPKTKAHYFLHELERLPTTSAIMSKKLITVVNLARTFVFVWM